MNIKNHNGDTLEYRYDAFYVTSKSGKNVFINEGNENVPTDNRMYVENGDSFAIVGNQFYLFSKRSAVYVNNEKRFYLFPSHVSESFQDFCKQAIDLKRKEIHGQSFVSAKFAIAGLSFTILSPSTKNGHYTLLFKDAFPSSGPTIAQNIEKIQKKYTQLYGCPTEYSTEKNTLLIKMKYFDFNVLFDILYQLSSENGPNEMSHFTA